MRALITGRHREPTLWVLVLVGLAIAIIAVAVATGGAAVVWREIEEAGSSLLM
jgi:hypothetical protein